LQKTRPPGESRGADLLYLFETLDYGLFASSSTMMAS